MSRVRRVCASCADPIAQPTVGRPRMYCSPACRQRAYDRRRTRRPRNDWHTPDDVRVDVLSRWALTLDAAATQPSAVVPNYLGPDHEVPARRDALAFDDWSLLAGDGAVWLNPPYMPTRLLSAFLARAVATAVAGVPVVGLVPASTGAAGWWSGVMDPGAEVEFLRGRLAFTGPHSTPGATAPWPSALVVWAPPA